jgi:hypothetical protein
MVFGHTLVTFLSFLYLSKMPNNTPLSSHAFVLHVYQNKTCFDPLKPLEKWSKEAKTIMLGQKIQP